MGDCAAMKKSGGILDKQTQFENIILIEIRCTNMHKYSLAFSCMIKTL